MKTLTLIILMSAGYAWSSPDVWKDSSQTLRFLPNKLEFFNRSSCAKMALEPTTSVFAIVDNVNVAKSLYRMARLAGKDSTSVTNAGIERFRYTLTSTIRLVGSRLLSGSLPMIPLDGSKISDPILKDALANCKNGSCHALDSEIAKAWNKNITPPDAVSCKVVKRFSTFHSNLRMSKPDRVLMNELAKEMNEEESFITDCSDLSDLSQPEVALYQFDVTAPGKDFKKNGFDFWNSLKVYLAWAIRNSPEAHAMAAPYDFLFESLNVEEMLIFFSNGCRSMKPLSCSENDLTLQNLRAFTQGKDGTDWSELPANQTVGSSPAQDLFSRPLPLLEQDLLNLGSQKNANDWTENFRDNFIKSRGYNKVRLLKASADLKLVTDHLTPERILERITRDTKEMSPEEKQELYALCAEYAVALDENLGTMRKTIANLKNVKALSDVMEDINSLDLGKVWPFVSGLSDEVNKFCGGLKQREVWGQDFTFDKTGFAPWYQTLVDGKKYHYGESTSIRSSPQLKPLLRIRDTNVPICTSGVHCARITLAAVMSLSAITQSLGIITPEDGGISSNMANPYADQFSCGLYDPWAKRNQIIFNFFQDMATAAIMGFAPSPIYVAATLEPKRVVSFETLVKEGLVYYDPHFDKARLKFSVMGDLGTLTGVPCAVSISGTKLNPYEYYTFNGLSVSSCRSRTTNTTTAGSGGEATSKNDYTQACFTCAINLQSAASAASVVAPGFRAGFFILKGLVRLLKDIQDPHDLAKNWELDPQAVALAHRKDGDISKSCAQNLLRGETCFEEECEGQILKDFTRAYKASPVTSEFRCDRGRGSLTIKECASPVNFRWNAEGGKVKIETDCKLGARTL